MKKILFLLALGLIGACPGLFAAQRKPVAPVRVGAGGYSVRSRAMERELEAEGAAMQAAIAELMRAEREAAAEEVAVEAAAKGRAAERDSLSGSSAASAAAAAWSSREWPEPPAYFTFSEGPVKAQKAVKLGATLMSRYLASPLGAKPWFKTFISWWASDEELAGYFIASKSSDDNVTRLEKAVELLLSDEGNELIENMLRQPNTIRALLNPSPEARARIEKYINPKKMLVPPGKSEEVARAVYQKERRQNLFIFLNVHVPSRGEIPLPEPTAAGGAGRVLVPA